MRRILFVFVLYATATCLSLASPAMLAQGRGGAGAGQPDPWPNSKKLLAIADVQSGFHHDSISHALATVEQIGRKSGAYMTMIRTDSQLITKGQIAGTGRYEGRSVNARTLNYYDAIFMLPSGFGTMSDQQKADLLSFVRDDGKGLIVGHATGVAFTNWPEFGEMVGGYMDGEFNANAKVIVEDPAFPGAMAFGGQTFMFNDQHPVFKAPYSRDKVHVILRLDPESLDATNRARRPDGDFAVVWAKQFGKGRVYNVGWGHPDATWDDPKFQAMMLEGIKWAIGVTSADVTPRPFPKASAPAPRVLEGRESLHSSQVFDTAFEDARPAERGKTNTATSEAKPDLTVRLASPRRNLAGVPAAAVVAGVPAASIAVPRAQSSQKEQKDPLPDGPGKTTVQRICSDCHAIEQAVSMRGTPKDWQDVVELMIDRGATGSEEDFRTVVAYLAKYFGPKGGAH